MKMSKVLAAAAAFGLAIPVMADTLELRVRGASDATTATSGAAVEVNIQGRIQGATDFGLALWGANLSDTLNANDVTGAVLDSPGGDIDQFKKNLGLTNPAGYGGTAIGNNLIQIGGGQNTIGNAGPTLFPVGTVATDVANGAAWVTLATGTFDSTGATGDVVLNLDTGFANTLAAATGPVFPVNAATVTIDATGLTIGGGVADFTGVASVADHSAIGTFAGGPLDISIDAGDAAAKSGYIDPRQVDAAPGPMSVRVDFAEAVTGGSVVSAGLTGLVATPNGNSLDITFDAPANGTCHSFDITGTTTSVGTVDEGAGSADADFCVCYFEADVDFSSVVNPTDRTVIANGANLFQTMDSGTIFGPQVDLDRNGIANPTDRTIVAQGTNLFNNFTGVDCP